MELTLNAQQIALKIRKFKSVCIYPTRAKRINERETIFKCIKLFKRHTLIQICINMLTCSDLLCDRKHCECTCMLEVSAHRVLVSSAPNESQRRLCSITRSSIVARLLLFQLFPFIHLHPLSLLFVRKQASRPRAERMMD